MHELAICHALMTQVQGIAEERNASSVVAIVVGIGPLSGVEAPLLKNAYPIASAGTVAENARLVIEDLPVQVHCDQCGNESAVAANKLVCPHCNNWQTKLVSGDELLLMSVELEKPGEASINALH